MDLKKITRKSENVWLSKIISENENFIHYMNENSSFSKYFTWKK